MTKGSTAEVCPLLAHKARPFTEGVALQADYAFDETTWGYRARLGGSLGSLTVGPTFTLTFTGPRQDDADDDEPSRD